MKVTAYCKKDDARLEGAPPAPLVCPECQATYPLEWTPAHEQGRVEKCAVCGHGELHLRKDFPRQIGLLIVLVAAALCFTQIFPPGLFFLPLIIASVIDLGLYFVLPWKVVCYVCEAEYSGAVIDPAMKPFDLETATEQKRKKWGPKDPTPGGA